MKNVDEMSDKEVAATFMEWLNSTTELRLFNQLYVDKMLREEGALSMSNTGSDHYEGKVRPLELIDAMGDLPAFCRGNIIKYIRRSISHEDKLGSLQKALNYLNLLIFLEKGGTDVKGFIAAGFNFPAWQLSGCLSKHTKSLTATEVSSPPKTERDKLEKAYAAGIATANQTCLIFIWTSCPKCYALCKGLYVWRGVPPELGSKYICKDCGNSWDAGESLWFRSDATEVPHSSPASSSPSAPSPDSGSTPSETCSPTYPSSSCPPHTSKEDVGKKQTQ